MSKSELKAMEAELSTAVYEATAIVERWESEGRITGNGRHFRQRIAALAASELRDRIDPKRRG